MTVEIYMAIALLCMSHDAYDTYKAQIRYRWILSAIAALLWPLSAAVIIVSVICQRPTERSCSQEAL